MEKINVVSEVIGPVQAISNGSRENGVVLTPEGFEIMETANDTVMSFVKANGMMQIPNKAIDDMKVFYMKMVRKAFDNYTVNLNDLGLSADDFFILNNALAFPEDRRDPNLFINKDPKYVIGSAYTYWRKSKRGKEGTNRVKDGFTKLVNERLGTALPPPSNKKGFTKFQTVKRTPTAPPENVLVIDNEVVEVPPTITQNVVDSAHKNKIPVNVGGGGAQKGGLMTYLPLIGLGIALLKG